MSAITTFSNPKTLRLPKQFVLNFVKENILAQFPLDLFIKAGLLIMKVYKSGKVTNSLTFCFLSSPDFADQEMIKVFLAQNIIPRANELEKAERHHFHRSRSKSFFYKITHQKRNIVSFSTLVVISYSGR